MRYLAITFCLLITSICGVKAQNKKIKVSILGVYHFMGSPNDNLSNDPMNMLNAKNQQQLQQLSKRLARFRPNKIALEDKRQEFLNNSYKAYRKGAHRDRQNEIYQVGFRLANELKHSKVYAIDAPGNWFYKSVEKFAEENGQMHILKADHEEGEKWMADFNKKLKTQPLIQNLQEINKPAAYLENHSSYIDAFVKIGKGNNYIGTELTADWYKRNLKVFTNIVRIAQPGDHILLMMGVGHAHIIRQLLKDSPMFEYIEINEYLK